MSGRGSGTREEEREVEEAWDVLLLVSLSAGKYEEERGGRVLEKRGEREEARKG